MKPLAQAGCTFCLALLLAACASAPESTTAAGGGSAKAGVPASDAAGDDPMVCSVEEVTATRVRVQRICKPASKWDRQATQAQETTDQMQYKGSMAPHTR